MGAFCLDRLCIRYLTGARSGISGVPNCQVSFQAGQIIFLESLADQAHGGLYVDLFPVAGGNPSALLATVLEGKKSEKGKPGYVRTGGVNPKDTAAFMDFVCQCSPFALLGSFRRVRWNNYKPSFNFRSTLRLADLGVGW